MSAISQNALAETPVSVEPDPLWLDYAELRISVTDEIIFRPALREILDEFPFVQFEVEQDIQQTLVFDDTVNFLQTTVQDSYEFQGIPGDNLDQSPGIPFGPLTINSIGAEQYEGLMNYEPAQAHLEIDVDVETSSTINAYDSAELAIAVTSEDIYRPVLILIVTDPAELDIAVTDQVTFFYPHAGGTVEAATGLPIGPLSLNAISEEQYDGFMNFQPGLGKFEIGDQDQVQVVYSFDDSAPFFTFVDADDFFRPILRENVVTSAELEISGSDLTYLFASNGYGYLEQSPGIPVQTISENPIATEQYVFGTFALTYEIESVAQLVIDAEVIARRNNIDLQVSDTVPLEITAEDQTEQIFVFDDQGTLETAFGIEDYDSINISRLYAQSAVLDIDVSDEVATSAVYVDTATLALTITASDNARSEQVQSATLDVTASHVEERLFVYDDNVDFLQTVVTSIEFQVSTDNIGNLDLTASEETSSTRGFVLPYVQLQVEASHVEERLFVYDDLAEFLKADASSIEYLSNIEDSTSLTLGSASTDLARYRFEDVGSLQIAAIQTNTNALTSTDDAALEVDGTFAVNKIFEYNETATFLQASAADIVQISKNDNTVYLELAGAATQSTTHVYEDTAQFLETVVTSTEYQSNVDDAVTIDIAAEQEIRVRLLDISSAELITTSTVVNTNTLTSTENAALVTTATDLTSVTYSIDDTAQFLETVIVSEEITSATDNTGSLNVAVVTDVKQRFVFSDTATFFQAAATSIEYQTEVVGTVPLQVAATDEVKNRYVFDETAALITTAYATVSKTLSYTTTVPVQIDVVQSIGIGETSRAQLETTASDVHRFRYAFTETAPTVISSTVVQRNIRNYVDTTSVAIENDDLTSTLHLYPLTTVGLELDFDVANVSIFNYVDVTNLGTVVVADDEQTSNVETIPFVQFGATDEIEQLFVFDDSATLEQAVEQQIQQIFVFEDTTSLGTYVVEDTDYISVIDSVSFFTFAATDVVIQTFNVPSTGELEISDTNTQSVRYVISDTAQFLETVVTSTEILVNIEQEGVLNIAATAQVKQVFVFDDTTGLILDGDFVLVKSISQITSGGFEWTGYSFAQGYTLFKQIYANDVIAMRIEVDSDEMKIANAGQQVSRQFWIG